MPFLNRQIADALCTVITLGFIKNNEAAVHENCKTSFNYSIESDPEQDQINIENHNVFTGWIKDNLEIVLNIDQAKQQSEMPCIMTRTQKVWTNAQIKGIVDDFRSYITEIDSKAKDKGKAPRGAYIGGMSTVSGTNIIGPSALGTYERKYREDLKDIEENFRIAQDQANIAIKILSEAIPKVKAKYKIPIQYDDTCCKLPLASIGSNQLFRSYHGMIRAMMEIPPSTTAPDAVYFEIALGVNTPKVSSCIPCSIFMSANDMAATSTHFGRGDNWGIPEFSLEKKTLQTEPKTKWRARVKNHYKTGLNLCTTGGLSGQGVTNIGEMKEKLDTKDEEIPDIFLEALTFEGPFLEKMANTLGFPYKKGKK
jgi:hypothetical protein